MKSLIYATAIAALLGTPALAADMALKAPPAPAAVSSWTSCYIGANIGGAWSRNHYVLPEGGNENEGSLTAGGFAGGGQAGCDYQFSSNWLIGIQGMFDGTGIRGTDIDPNNDGDSYPTTLHWFATVTGRLGVLVTPTMLLYAKGGAAWVNEKIDYNSLGVQQAASGNFTRSGWVGGGGAEWMFAPTWSVWIEYDHLDFGTQNINETELHSPGGFTEAVKQSIDMALVGVTWRFNGGP